MQWKEELASLLDLPSIVRPQPGCERSLASLGRESLVHSRCLRLVGRFREAAGGARSAGIGALGSARRRRGARRNTRHWPARRSRRPGCPRINRRLAVRDAAFGRPNQFDALCRISVATPFTARLFPPDARRRGCGAGPGPQQGDGGAADRSRARNAPAARTVRRCCGHRRAAAKNPALLATVFRKRALSSAGAWPSLVRRLASMASPPSSETQPWLPLEEGRRR